MNSTNLKFDQLFTPHIVCVSQSAAMWLKLIETMDSDYVITLCSTKNLCLLSHSFDLGIVCADMDFACESVLAQLPAHERVIVVGDHLKQSDVAHAFERGIIDYFPDPIDYVLLWQRVDSLIRKTY